MQNTLRITLIIAASLIGLAGLSTQAHASGDRSLKYSYAGSRDHDRRHEPRHHRGHRDYDRHRHHRDHHRAYPRHRYYGSYYGHGHLRGDHRHCRHGGHYRHHGGLYIGPYGFSLSIH